MSERKDGDNQSKNTPEQEETIAAIATPAGSGGLGKVRISGSRALKIADSVFTSPSGKSLSEVASHTIHYGFIRDKEENKIDEVLALVLKSPRSFTSEDTVEFDCHGGMMPLNGVLEAVLQAGARMAEPGEFSRRAFLNGRIDLSQAEAIIDLINSQTEKSRELAMQQLQGNLSSRIKDLRDDMLELLSQLEATCDFPEDEIPGFAGDELDERIENMLSPLKKLIASSREGRIYREGLKTVIAGKPNVGKSSLLNTLLNEERAIVTEVPGTTRDVISEIVNLEGIPLRITDTAGIRTTDDQVEKIGVARSESSLRSADLVLFMLDVSQGLTEEDREIFAKIQEKPLIILVNKTDLPADLDREKIEKNFPGAPVLFISVEERRGLKELKETIVELIFSDRVVGDHDYTVTRLRHRRALEKARESLEHMQQACKRGMPEDMLSIDLRDALHELGKITGETVTEDMVEKIFSDFCVGK
ncbi:tRNA uridine-5-carboxymethylaminomethyl(34) synthesis GTPase MnmE [Halarsenatibacter silvermanii]|uniref:tRNA modification GTPase MnmE n=1 Tax=Halarsenatibacter silvermanii TaxID=321763 RepID=A0A1G9Q5C3_9FIRM|nr:tRNA uridine-5-carboxymethylaminomethyl(34) synthesis GTPase MnmE [Halarsenatibacter silvermanii]SDM06244.1 tRNA modification GTPase trmE [Halarsenatibacter silvermanii]